MGAAALLGAGLASFAAPQPARASDWGCQVILCLATPGSPTTYAQCVAPITKLWKTLAFGGSFPTCTEGGIGTSTRKIRNGYQLQVATPDGAVSSYTVNTKTQTIANNNPTVAP
jgi:hypothetical protein